MYAKFWTPKTKEFQSPKHCTISPIAFQIPFVLYVGTLLQLGLGKIVHGKYNLSKSHFVKIPQWITNAKHIYCIWHVNKIPN